MQIDHKSPIPIYIQLKERLVFAIDTGEYRVGDQLPTVRQMAVECKINLNTVRKVYHELEIEGYISTQQGKGTFVLGVPERKNLEEDYYEEVDHLLENVLIRGYARGLSSSDILNRLAMRIKNNGVIK